MEKIKILIAEDDRLAQAFYNKGLSNDRFDKKFVGNGEEAVMAYRAWKPDVIVLDIQMPVKGGYAALDDIRVMEKSVKKKTPIIMASAMSKKDDMLNCAKLGIEGYILKPFKAEEITDSIMGYYNKFLSSQG